MSGVVFYVRLLQSNSIPVPCPAQLSCNIHVIASIAPVKTREKVIKTKKEVAFGPEYPRTSSPCCISHGTDAI